jgi:hypothetical protein
MLTVHVNTGTPHLNIQDKVFFLYGEYRYFRDKNMGKSVMTLIAEHLTLRFLELN